MRDGWNFAVQLATSPPQPLVDVIKMRAHRACPPTPLGGARATPCPPPRAPFPGAMRAPFARAPGSRPIARSRPPARRSPRARAASPLARARRLGHHPQWQSRTRSRSRVGPTASTSSTWSAARASSHPSTPPPSSASARWTARGRRSRRWRGEWRSSPPPASSSPASSSTTSARPRTSCRGPSSSASSSRSSARAS